MIPQARFGAILGGVLAATTFVACRQPPLILDATPTAIGDHYTLTVEKVGTV